TTYICVVLYLLYSCLFFFFQAEDGIRDRNVTGVQTCALPIYSYSGTTPAAFDCSGYTSYVFNQAGRSLPRTAAGQYSATTRISRSEERRVGKECRYRWAK